MPTFGSRSVLIVLACVAMAVVSSTALAEDAAVTARLSNHGGLAMPTAKRLVGKVGQRMMKAADALASASDPLRVALSQALFRRPQPPDQMASAKIRLKLYAGLTEWALEALFSPRPGLIAACTRDYGATQAECEALVAAAARSSVVQARAVAGGAAAPVPAAGFAAAPSRAPMAPAGGSRFGNFSSGFGGRAASPPPRYTTATPAQQFGSAPVAVARPAPVARPSGMSQKQAYQAQREAYLARQKAQFEERKQALAAAAAPKEPAAAPAAGPAAPAAMKPAAAPAAAEEAPAEEAPAGNSKPALDSDFLDGLLADPLGGK